MIRSTLLFAVLFFTFQSHALNLESYEGTYRSPVTSGTFDVEKDGNDLFITYSSHMTWHKSIRGKSFLYICVDRICEAKNVGLWDDILKIRENGELFIQYKFSNPEDHDDPSEGIGSYSYLPTIESEAKPSTWLNTELDYGTATVFNSSVQNPARDSELVVSCQQTNDLYMTVAVSKTLWTRAVTALATYDYLSVEMDVDKKSLDNSEWVLGQDINFINNTPLSKNDIKRIQKGNVISYRFFAENTIGERLYLGHVAFSLKGSNDSLNQTLDACSL